MKKIVALFMLSCSFLFAQINLQTATKDELMGIKEMGEKKIDKFINIAYNNF